MAEAAGVAGDPKTAIPLQKRQWLDEYKRSGKKFNGYDRDFDRQVPVGGRFADKAEQAGVALQPHLKAPRYTVQPGDTVGEVAKRLGLEPNQFMRAYKLKNPKDLKAGWMLTAPAAEPSVEPVTPKSSTPDTAPDRPKSPEQKDGSLLDGKPVTQDVAETAKPVKPAKPEVTPELDYMAKAIT